MFVDKNRSVAVVMGEQDNKKAINTMKKHMVMEKRKSEGNGEAEYEDSVELQWEHYYEKVKE